MEIKFLDLPVTYQNYTNRINDKLLEITKKGEFVLGKELLNFENNFSKYINSNWCIGVNSGSDALKIALIASGVNSNDEVIVPEHTFIATWQSVVEIGAIPVPCKINDDNYLLDIENVKSLINPKVKAIIPVHLYGNPCNIDVLNQIANNYGISVIEDAAQAHGSRINNKKVGSHGNLVAWSFYPGKTLGAFGDGGAITGFSKKQYDFVKKFRNYGSIEKYKHEIYGINSRLDNLQAAILNIKLEFLDININERNEIAKIYNQELINNDWIKKPLLEKNKFHSWHLYVIKVKKYRNQLIEYLTKEKVTTLIHYPSLPFHQEPYKQFKPSNFQETKVYQEIVSLPFYPGIPKKHILRVSKLINKFFEKIS